MKKAVLRPKVSQLTFGNLESRFKPTIKVKKECVSVFSEKKEKKKKIECSEMETR